MTKKTPPEESPTKNNNQDSFKQFDAAETWGDSFHSDDSETPHEKNTTKSPSSNTDYSSNPESSADHHDVELVTTEEENPPLVPARNSTDHKENTNNEEHTEVNSSKEDLSGLFDDPSDQQEPEKNSTSSQSTKDQQRDNSKGEKTTERSDSDLSGLFTDTDTSETDESSTDDEGFGFDFEYADNKNDTSDSRNTKSSQGTANRQNEYGENPFDQPTANQEVGEPTVEASDKDPPTGIPDQQLRSPTELVTTTFSKGVNAVKAIAAIFAVLILLSLRGILIAAEWGATIFLFMYFILVGVTLLIPSAAPAFMISSPSRLGAIFELSIIILPAIIAVFALSMTFDEIVFGGSRYETEKPLSRL